MRCSQNKGIVSLCVLLSFLILSACSLSLQKTPQALHLHHWKVQGGGNIGKELQLWLNTVSEERTSTPVTHRSVVYGDIDRRRRIIALSAQGNVIRYLQETKVNVQVEDENKRVLSQTVLFAARQYAEGADASLFVQRLNEEMDTELARRSRVWLSHQSW